MAPAPRPTPAPAGAFLCPKTKNPRLDQIRDATKMIRDGENRQAAGGWRRRARDGYLPADW